jgi:hypothetical protein
MAIALLVMTLLATGGFAVTSVHGFLLQAGPSAAIPFAKAAVSRHVGLAIPTVLLSLFSQSMVMFFFIGTGRLVKDEIATFPEPEKSALLTALRRFKRQTSPAATFALLSAIAVFVLGGAVHTRALPSWSHLASALVALTLHTWALIAEAKTFSENGRLMADPLAWARSATAARPSSFAPPRP